MGNFARVQDGIVVEVISINNDVLGDGPLNETENAGRMFITDVLNLSGEWFQTSYNGNFRKHYAGIGFSYDADKDEFVPEGWELVDGEWTLPVTDEPAETD